MGKNNQATDRKRRIEAARRQEKAAERRRTVLTIVLSVLAGAALIGGTVYATQKDKDKPPETALTAIGVGEIEANCLPTTTEGKTGGHATTAITYPAAPPSSGEHNPTPLPGTPQFRDRSDGTDKLVERAVHDLEHGAIVIWYDKKLADDQVDLLRQVATSAGPRVLVVPWNRADFPEGRSIALTAWSHTRRCTSISGDVIQSFITEYRDGKDAPERGAAL